MYATKQQQMCDFRLQFSALAKIPPPPIQLRLNLASHERCFCTQLLFIRLRPGNTRSPQCNIRRHFHPASVMAVALSTARCLVCSA